MTSKPPPPIPDAKRFIKIRKNDKALFIATFCYGMSIVSSLLALEHPFFFFVAVLLFPIGAWNLKLLWIYSLGVGGRNKPHD